jgi:hypothetical protein
MTAITLEIPDELIGKLESLLHMDGETVEEAALDLLTISVDDWIRPRDAGKGDEPAAPDTPLTLALAHYIVAQPPPPRAVAEWHAVRDALAGAASAITPSSGNVFADLGRPDAAAKKARVIEALADMEPDAPTAPAQPAVGSALAPLAPEAWKAVRSRAVGVVGGYDLSVQLDLHEEGVELPPGKLNREMSGKIDPVTKRIEPLDRIMETAVRNSVRIVDECMNGSPPVYVLAGTPHPYGDEAWMEVTDGVGRVFPCREAAVRWLKAMGREA